MVFKGVVPWATKDDIAAAHKTTRALIRDVLKKLEVKMGKVEDALMEVDAATDEVADDLQALIDQLSAQNDANADAVVAALQPRIDRLRSLGKLNDDVPLDGDTPSGNPGDVVVPGPVVDPETGNTGAPIVNAPDVTGQPLTPVVTDASVGTPVPAPGEPKE